MATCAEMPAELSVSAMVWRESDRSIVAVLPLIVTVPERSSDEISRRDSTEVEELLNRSLSAAPVTLFLITVPVELNPSCWRTSVEEAF